MIIVIEFGTSRARRLNEGGVVQHTSSTTELVKPNYFLA